MKKFFLVMIFALPLKATVFAQIPDSDSSSFADSGWIFIAILIFGIIFTVCRELLCWYWKVNKMVSNQEEIIRLLKKIAHENNIPPIEPKLKENKNGVIKDLVVGTKFMITGK